MKTFIFTARLEKSGWAIFYAMENLQLNVKKLLKIEPCILLTLVVNISSSIFAKGIKNYNPTELNITKHYTCGDFIEKNDQRF